MAQATDSLVSFPPKDITDACRKFISALEDECALARAETMKPFRSAVATGETIPEDQLFPAKVKGRIKSTGKAGFRSSAEQADSLTKRSPSCFSAHMTNKARHVNVSVNGGKFCAGLSGLKLSKDNQKRFKAAWVAAMKRAGVHNNKGVLAWGQGDEFHLQLPGAYKRSSQTRNLERKCLDAYLKLTREGSNPKNTDFEGKAKNLKKLEAASKRTGIDL